MKTFIIRNNTLEVFFGFDGVSYSGYGDISAIPNDADRYVWLYQVPFKADRALLAEEVRGYTAKFGMAYSAIPDGREVLVFTLENLFDVRYCDSDRILDSAILEFNKFILDFSDSHANVKVVDFSEFIGGYPASSRVDWRFYFLSQMAFNPHLAADFKKWYSRKLEGFALKRKKCLVLDLDNTLWGGILGEDGPDGIKIGGDYPGNAFLLFQELLVELSKSGVILAVCSKNNEKDVLEVWEKNPFIALSGKYISAYRINWQDKATNLKELAKELNIGLDSFVFLDDNPNERELIRQILPMVAVPDFPYQPYDLPVFFKAVTDDYFRVYEVTAEDLSKAEQYKANAARESEKVKFSDFEDYLKSLDMQLTVRKSDEFNIPRIAQMSGKTNQFNLTTRRYSEMDIRNLAAEGDLVYCLDVSDRFGESGITGAAVIKISGREAYIDTFLLSCRVLGRGIEVAFLKELLSILSARGIERVKAEYIPTEKNGLVADFYDKFGFSPEREDGDVRKYSLVIEGRSFEIEDYYKINVL